MPELKNSRAQSRLEKAAREGGNIWVGYEMEAKAVREKTARLRALRIAKEAADKSAAAVDQNATAPKPATKRAVKPSERRGCRRIDQKTDSATGGRATVA